MAPASLIIFERTPQRPIHLKSFIANHMLPSAEIKGMISCDMTLIKNASILVAAVIFKIGMYNHVKQIDL